ncbi:hypothetical protein CTAM01_14495 [Colletotrichum tamarilloi]|uniref:Uncharacterized protein n=1 Tax=Colletotrichum tamarilloi TaxID=1209934 RepID=A0ABQ9QP40_9PEZI|nr:uncharacterized protein CTAM01_14495 [Colletotrichum tamarilloi]KAI3528937.1 hypothetical protein CSPX01_15889 [Colletotrichum filicis]KAK1480225.1 hypothetical protein CTAM01_14495 [Colletotrichum tamarilloi]
MSYNIPPPLQKANISVFLLLILLTSSREKTVIQLFEQHENDRWYFDCPEQLQEVRNTLGFPLPIVGRSSLRLLTGAMLLGRLQGGNGGGESGGKEAAPPAEDKRLSGVVYPMWHPSPQPHEVGELNWEAK